MRASEEFIAFTALVFLLLLGLFLAGISNLSARRDLAAVRDSLAVERQDLIECYQENEKEHAWAMRQIAVADSFWLDRYKKALR